eukprot:TRINITY_DN21241_c0_g1_i2.p2 TRINITY_DN21241_c0_g1~~TRINITY_DN21241_c0_g1_i2.p2  ORF type:complete len:242 (+),score=29.15 TRINITY_DN21241_c0_g1_i2:612-1337(+)
MLSRVVGRVGSSLATHNVNSLQGVGLRCMSHELGFNPESGDLFYNPYTSDKFLYSLMYSLLRPIRVAKGDPLTVEVGIGGGFVLPLYYERGRKIHGVDPNPDHNYLRANLLRIKCPVEDIQLEIGQIEKSQLEDNYADFVVSVLTLSCVSNVDKSLEQIKRILKPGGMYFFMENTLEKEFLPYRIYQNLSTPWNRVANHNMRLNRDMERHLKRAGFAQLKTRLADCGTQPLMPMCYGYAVK